MRRPRCCLSAVARQSLRRAQNTALVVNTSLWNECGDAKLTYTLDWTILCHCRLSGNGFVGTSEEVTYSIQARNTLFRNTHSYFKDRITERIIEDTYHEKYSKTPRLSELPAGTRATLNPYALVACCKYLCERAVYSGEHRDPSGTFLLRGINLW